MLGVFYGGVHRTCVGVSTNVLTTDMIEMMHFSVKAATAPVCDSARLDIASGPQQRKKEADEICDWISPWVDAKIDATISERWISHRENDCKAIPLPRPWAVVDPSSGRLTMR